MDQHSQSQDFSGEIYQPLINAALVQMQIQALDESLRRLSKADDSGLRNPPELEGDGDLVKPNC